MKIRKRLEAPESGGSMVADTGIEPVTPTVSNVFCPALAALAIHGSPTFTGPCALVRLVT
jgi:hypothetical protein